jgi:hypothetical protein|tara:strand:+ start:2159 stop:2602 length:444 start_codon:yes stop_codon:yes gene_type:complete
MKKKKNIRTLIRGIVREEVAMAIHEVISELKQPVTKTTSQKTSQPKQNKKIVEKKNFSNNSVLNDVLNETAMGDMEDWPSMGGETFDSNSANEIMSSAYSNVQPGSESSNGDIIATPSAPDNIKNLFNKDYSQILKKSIEKSKGRNG